MAIPEAGLESIIAAAIACERGGRSVFRDLSFTLERGQVLALEGPNGAGKTSTLRILAGLLPQAEGTIQFYDGTNNVTDAEERGRFAAWLGHQDGIKAQLSVRENAAFFASLFGARKAADVLERVGLAGAADWPAHFLSAGQRRRLALARLLLSNRPLWLLDEPNAALDSGGRELVTALVTEHCTAGGIAIIASHETSALASNRVALGGQK